MDKIEVLLILLTLQSCLKQPGQKNAGCWSFLGGSPKPRQNVNQQLRYYCSSTASQAPLRSPKRVKRLPLKSVRGCLPQSLHSPQLSEPDPIYPYLPFLFWLPSWQWPCHSRHGIQRRSRLTVLRDFSD